MGITSYSPNFQWVTYFVVIHKDSSSMQQNLVELAKELIAIPSASTISNAAISEFLLGHLQRLGFEVERLAYREPTGEEKVSLVAKIGAGTGGLGFFSHSDTVPGDAGAWEPFQPNVQAGRLIGRGACDMKGPLAATIAAAAQVNASRLRKPIYVVVTADEEVGYGGAYQVVRDSTLFKANWPSYGVVAEPTRLIPVYAHKGGIQIYVTAQGRAAHTSTDQGISANFLIAPFMAEMAELLPLFRSDKRFQNADFDPPTNGFNMVINDGNCKSNVTAAQTTITLSIRTMPNDHHQEAVELITQKAKKYNLDVRTRGGAPFFTAPDSRLIQATLQASGLSRAETVPFGTEALVYQGHVAQQVILGPGDIAQAHTIGEWIDVTALEKAAHIYTRLIETFCLGS
jgi:acetylornithine deacetylase